MAPVRSSPALSLRCEVFARASFDTRWLRTPRWKSGWDCGSRPPPGDAGRSHACRRGLRVPFPRAQELRETIWRGCSVGLTPSLQSLAEARCQPEARLTNNQKSKEPPARHGGAAHRVVSELCQRSSLSLVLQPRFPARRRWGREAAREGVSPSLASPCPR